MMSMGAGTRDTEVYRPALAFFGESIMREGNMDMGVERGVLTRFVGPWRLTGKLYDKDPKGEPKKVEGWWEADFLGDSSFLITKSKGCAGGLPFERLTILFFDAQNGKYTAAGANTAFPNRLMLEEGIYDEANQTISWKEHTILALGSGE
jgi:hypothetical protein